MATKTNPEKPHLVWLTNYPLAEIESREVIFCGATIKEPMPFNNYSTEDLEDMGICGVYAEADRPCEIICTRPLPKLPPLLGVEYVPDMH